MVFKLSITLFKEQTRSLPSHEAGAQSGAQELALLTTSLNQSFRKFKNCVLRNCARECRLCTLACFSTCMSDGDVTLSFHTCAVSRGSLPLLLWETLFLFPFQRWGNWGWEELASQRRKGNKKNETCPHCSFYFDHEMLSALWRVCFSPPVLAPRHSPHYNVAPAL